MGYDLKTYLQTMFRVFIFPMLVAVCFVITLLYLSNIKNSDNNENKIVGGYNTIVSVNYAEKYPLNVVCYTDFNDVLFESKYIHKFIKQCEYDSIEKWLESNKNNIEKLANVLYHEARGVSEDSHVAAVAWCVLNRVDSEYYSNDLNRVITSPNQFAYRKRAKLFGDLYDRCHYIAEDVCIRWLLESFGYKDIGRVLPKEYLYFYGHGKNGIDNKFRTTNDTKDKNCKYWDWSLESPYI